MKIIPTEQILGARVQGLDLSRMLTDTEFDTLVLALGNHGVLEFPNQTLTTAQLKAFSQRFGKLYISPGGRAQAEGFPEVMILSNMVQDGKPLGLSDAGQSWHTDMSYSNMIAFANVLHGTVIPQRQGKPLGATQFRNTHAAYNDIPQVLKERLANKTITHDFNKFWDMMRKRPGSTRPALSEEEKRKRPPAVHPAFLTHPITRQKVLYANPGYAMRIDQLSQDESDEMLTYLFEHQLRPEFRYANQWEAHDVLMWDNMGTIHNAVPDYLPHEHRYIRRCQVAATHFFDQNGNRRTSLTAIAA
jgi:taurine dioxygenase